MSCSEIHSAGNVKHVSEKRQLALCTAVPWEARSAEEAEAYSAGASEQASPEASVTHYQAPF